MASADRFAPMPAQMRSTAVSADGWGFEAGQSCVVPGGLADTGESCSDPVLAEGPADPSAPGHWGADQRRLHAGVCGCEHRCRSGYRCHRRLGL